MIVDGPQKLRVVLSESELSEYDLTFSELDFESEKTKRMLNMLLIRAVRTAGFKPVPGRLTIEAYPMDGGCIICFTVKPMRSAVKVYRRKKPASRVFEFADENQLMDCIARAAALPESKTVKSTLYIFGGRYRLTVRGAADNGPLEALLTEYSVYIARSERILAATGEHGTLITGPDAIGTFGAHLLKLIN